MKILQILPALGQGGVERGTIEIAQALTAAGIPSGVVSAGGPMTRALEKLGVRHYTLPTNSKNPFVLAKNAGAIAKIAATEGYTLMHVRSRAPAWSVKWASKECGVPWMATFHGVYGLSPRCLKLPYNRVMLQGVRTIAVSDYVRRHILENYEVDSTKVVRIHRGADVNIFRPDAVSAEDALAKKTQQYHFAPDIPVITLPGRLTRWKGQEVFLEAVRLMRHKRVGLLFLGSDQGRVDYSDHLREMASSLSNETQVVFRDHSREIERVYALSEIVVNASTAQPEAFGRTIPEAQAMGCLVLGTAHGGACETIEDGVTGFLVPPGDAAAMARRLDEMLDMSAEAKAKMREAAIASVRNNFSVAKMCERTLELYRSLHGE
ncbi:MAG: glycosyltransferase family 4 protein [Kiritimatiellae bacterium]|nr:glycosyltransferase family 4 protein [Kiritimatiellia bacterium]